MELTPKKKKIISKLHDKPQSTKWNLKAAVEGLIRKNGDLKKSALAYKAGVAAAARRSRHKI